MPRVRDRLRGEAITPVIADGNTSWSDEHRRRHDRHVVPITTVAGRLLMPGQQIQLENAGALPDGCLAISGKPSAEVGDVQVELECTGLWFGHTCGDQRR
jgi:hypothetical protein